MTDEIKIESSIPIPEHARPGGRYGVYLAAMRKMNVGDSFVMKSSDARIGAPNLALRAGIKISQRNIARPGHSGYCRRHWEMKRGK